VDRARRLGTVAQMHVAEIPEENEHCRATRAPPPCATSTGSVCSARPARGARGVAGRRGDRAAGRPGRPVSHNAASNLKILGTPRIADMLDAGVLVGLGTDGAPSNNRMSIIDEMWLAAIVQKGLRRDPTVLPAEPCCGWPPRRRPGTRAGRRGRHAGRSGQPPTWWSSTR